MMIHTTTKKMREYWKMIQIAIVAFAIRLGMKNMIIRKRIEIFTVVVMKSHVTKNVGWRGEIKIFMVVIVKRNVTKNVRSRGEIEISTVAVVKRNATKNVHNSLSSSYPVSLSPSSLPINIDRYL